MMRPLTFPHPDKPRSFSDHVHSRWLSDTAPLFSVPLDPAPTRSLVTGRRRLALQPASPPNTSLALEHPRDRQAAAAKWDSRADGLLRRTHRTAPPFDIVFEQLSSCLGRHCRQLRALRCEEFVKGLLYGSRLFLGDSVNPFLGRGEAGPSGERGGDVHLGPFRMPPRAGELR